MCEPNASSSTSTSNPIIFDLTGSSHGSGHVRAIQSDVSSNVAAIALDDRHGVCSCEYFDMSGDSDCEHVPDDLRVVDLRSKMEYVRMVQISELDDDAVEIVIDSGSDASVIPFLWCMLVMKFHKNLNLSFMMLKAMSWKVQVRGRSRLFLKEKLITCKACSNPRI